jgi:ribose transport system substrate-binding protein
MQAMVRVPRRRRWRWLSVGLLIVLATVVAACGGSDDNGGGAATQTAASTAPVADNAVTEAQQRVDAIFDGALFAAPPAESPAPQTGKNVWQVNVGLAAAGGALFADGVKEAAKALDWKLTTFDGKFSPESYQDGIRQAIADKADGVILYTIDCSIIKSALRQAKSANIPVVAASSYDCDTQGEGEQPLFTAETNYLVDGKPQDSAAWSQALGRAQADWLIAKTGGKAKTILFMEKDIAIVLEVITGFQEQLKKCSGCTIAKTVDITINDIGPKLQQKTEQALLETPDADSVMVPYDDLMTGGIGPAINSSGRKDELSVIAGGGYESSLESVRNNDGLDAGYAVDIAWEGWSAADTLNRLFAGQEPASSGNGIGLFDADHNLGTSGAFQPRIDYVAGYKDAWAAAAGG